MAEEENLSLEESVVMERGNRRVRKEEPKLSDVRIFSGVFLEFETDHFFPFLFLLFFALFAFIQVSRKKQQYRG